MQYARYTNRYLLSFIVLRFYSAWLKMTIKVFRKIFVELNSLRKNVPTYTYLFIEGNNTN